jgi:16S rRNA (guanine527-N7)-methyltransferase
MSLRQALSRYGLSVPDAAYPKLKHYCDHLWEINQTLNLTRHTDFDKFAARDLLDTLELSKLIPERKEVLDVGSGGGVPGMVLAIIRPDLHVTLSESIGKKAKALNEIAERLNLDIEIYQTRAEELLEDFRYDFTTARGVGSLSKIGQWFQKVWPSVGRLLAIKGPNWLAEKKQADEMGLFKRCDIRVLAEYQVPDAEWKSTILQIKSSH